MELQKAIQERRSIRQFKSEPVPRSVLQEIFQAALRAPSAVNTQPWECWVVGGKTLRQLGQALYEEKAMEKPDRADFQGQEIWNEPYMRRMRDNGKGLYGILGIERGNMEKRRAFSLSMYKFFGAPQAIFLCLDAGLGNLSLFDCGLFAQTLCLLATSKSLGTCIQQSGVRYPDIIRQFIPIPNEKKILMAISIGYPDESAVVNRFRSNREPLGNFVHWVDLD